MVKVFTHARWTLTIHHRTLLSFHFSFQKTSLLWTNSSPKLPRKPSPHTPLLHREKWKTPLSFQCWNPQPVSVIRKSISPFNPVTPIHHRTFLFQTPISILIFQKTFLLWTNSSPNLPRKPSPHTPLLSMLKPPTRISSSKNHISF